MTDVTAIAASRLTLSAKAAIWGRERTFRIGTDEKRKADWNRIAFEFYLRHALQNHDDRYTDDEVEELSGKLAYLAYDR